MPRYGDLLAKLGSGQPLSIGEQNELRVLGNQQEAAAATVNAWSGGAGNLDANLFQSYAPPSFSILPHECASQFTITELAVPDTTWTTIVGDPASAATWSRGMRNSPATGQIHVTGVPKESAILILAWVSWKADMHGVKIQLRWSTNEGAGYTITDAIPAAITSGGYLQQIVHFRRLPTAETYYYIEAAQYSGSPQAIDASLFAIARLR